MLHNTAVEHYRKQRSIRSRCEKLKHSVMLTY